MRRLYSTFAGGWPGAGLLLMRLVAGAALVLRASSTLSSNPSIASAVASILLLVSGILLILGLWTPIAGILVALISVLQLEPRVAILSTPLFLGTIGTAIAMLGPGLWSVDARLFGWKRVEAPPRNNTSSPIL